MSEEDDHRYTAEEEDLLCSSAEYDDSDHDEDDDEDGYHSEDDDLGKDRSKSGNGNGEIKQHLAALLVAILAAVVTHAQLHGGFGVWKEELSKDWEVLKQNGLFGFGGNANTNSRGQSPAAAPFEASRYASAPSMDAIPVDKRKRVLERALGKDSAAGNNNHNFAGHERARNFRRTKGLSFCPQNGSTTTGNALENKTSNNGSNSNNLVEVEFILSLDLSVRVLHSYYLADAFRLDSSMVYEQMEEFGSYASDTILNEIDSLIESNENKGLMMTTLDEIESILESHLSDRQLVDGEHACLLHQYALNKSSGRSIRGTTRVYDRPHVSTFHRSKFPSSTSSSNNNNNNNELALAGLQTESIPPASLTFTGYAAKFINLSPQTLNLYWEGGRIPSGPKAGEMLASLVGTVGSMESIGTGSFPGHVFFLTPTYDREHVLKRWTISEDEPILYYDPVEDMSVSEQRMEMEKWERDGNKKWGEKQRFERDAWMVNQSFGRDYLIKTGRVWLAHFPQPYLDSDVQESETRTEEDGIVQEGHKMHMWQASYIGQTHSINTSNLYYTSLPQTLNRLTKDDYLPEAEARRRLEMRQHKGKKAGNDKNSNDSTAMPLALNVVSVAPRVLETNKFLSPVEVQHLIDLASGKKGDVIMERSSVSASNIAKVDSEGSATKKVRGSKSDARSSTGGWIHREQDAIVDNIFRRIADLLNVDEGLMRDKPRDHDGGDGGGDNLQTHDRIVEAMQLLRYGPGEEYSAHHDFTYPSIRNRYQPKRYATLLLYLTGEGDVIDENGIRRSGKNANNDDGLKGGGTTFPRAITTDFHDGVKVAPQSGKAVVFYNVLSDGNMDDLSQHSGDKVESGIKYVANVWVWDPIVN